MKNSRQRLDNFAPPGTTGSVYLLHFSAKIAGRAGHYLGWTRHLADRLDAHASGKGSRLMAECKRLGITFQAVAVWHDVDRNFERKLKNRNCHGLLCPICREGTLATRRAASRKRLSAAITS